MINLANLQMMFPPKALWKVNRDDIPIKPSPYVAKYLGKFNKLSFGRILTAKCTSLEVNLIHIRIRICDATVIIAALTLRQRIVEEHFFNIEIFHN